MKEETIVSRLDDEIEHFERIQIEFNKKFNEALECLKDLRFKVHYKKQ